MKKNVLINIKNNTSSVPYHADRELSKRIVDEIADNKSFQAVMEILSDK